MMLLTYSAANTRRWRLSRLRRQRGSVWVATAIIATMVLAALLAPLLAPHDPEVIDLSNVNAGPSAEHWLGTDSSGRDLVSRLLYGARLSLLGPLVVVLISLLVGVPAGLWAGYKRGWIDTAISRAVDLILAFPPLLLAIVVVATFGANFLVAAIALSITYVPLVARVVRGSVIAESEKDHVQAAKVLGFSDTRIMGVHLFPNVAGVVVAQSTLNFGYALLDLAGLAFLGLGTQPPTADWGQMLSDGRENILYSGFQVASASIVISVAVLSFNVLGDALAERFARK